MVPLNEPCLSVADIERLVAGDRISPAASRHAEACAACQAEIQTVRDESRFVQKVRDIAVPSLGPEGAPRIPGYRPQGIISSGAQGVVYRAVQESTSRTVAIKALSAGPTSSPRQRARAEREAEIAARLRHPNIVSVFESRRLSDGRIAVVMEFVDGVPLDAWKPPGATPHDRQVAILGAFLAVCQGIHHAHLNGVIHRDLKPDNILVTKEGRPVVLDFGIAKIGGIRTTLTGEFAGTPAYASPEQVAGHPDEVDALTDVYSLGVILYRLLCASMPYKVEGSLMDIAHAIQENSPVPLRHIDPTLSPDIEAITLRALRKDKASRYQSAAGLAKDIERYLSGDPVEARSGSGWYLLRKAVALNRRRLAWGAAAAALVVVAVTAVVLSLSSAAASARRAQQQHDAARAENNRARAMTELLREAIPNTDPREPVNTSPVDAGLRRLYFRLETGAFADEPALDQALRRMWGSIYTGFGSGKATGLVEYAEMSLRNGLVQLRIDHGAEHPDIAAAMHELAGVLLVRRRLPEAETICRSAIAMRLKLLGSSSIFVAQSRALLARVLHAEGRNLEAVEQADAVIVALSPLPEAEKDLLVAEMAAIKARSALAAGRFDQADAFALDALSRRMRRLPPEDADLLQSLEDAVNVAERAPSSRAATEIAIAWRTTAELAASVAREDLPILRAPLVGQFGIYTPTGRTDAIGRLLRLSGALLGSNDHAVVELLTAQVRASEGEGLMEVRADASLQAAHLLAKQFGPNDFSVLLCLENAAHIYSFTDRPERAVEIGRRACAIWESVPAHARDELLAANSRRRFATYLMLSKRYAEAKDQFEMALERFISVVGPEHHIVALASSGLAVCLAETGELARADKVSAQALELAKRMPTSAIDQFENIQFARAHTLCVLGRYAEALQNFPHPWASSFEFAGPKFVWRDLCAQDMIKALEATGELAAAADLKAQVSGSRVESSPHASE